MVKNNEPITVNVPGPRAAAPIESVEDRRPRLLRWILPTACSSAVPLTGMQQAELKMIAFH